MNPNAKLAPDRSQVLTKALLNASDFLGLNKSKTARVLGVSSPTMTRMSSGGYLLKESSKEWDAALLLVRLFRGLDAMTAGDNDSLKSWLNSDNNHLHGKPIDLIMDLSGLVHTVDYVDAFRAKV